MAGCFVGVWTCWSFLQPITELGTFIFLYPRFKLSQIKQVYWVYCMIEWRQERHETSLEKTSNKNGWFSSMFACVYSVMIIDPGRWRRWESKPTNFQIGKNPMDGSGWSYTNNEFLASMWAIFLFSRHHHIWFYICVKENSQRISPFLPTNHLFATDLRHSNGPAGTAQSHLVRKPKNRSEKTRGTYSEKDGHEGVGENEWLWCLGDLEWFCEVW